MFRRNLPFIAVTLFCVFFYFGFSFAFGGRPLEYDEVVEFYNSYGLKTPEGTKLYVQGRVYRPTKDAQKREQFLKYLIEAMDLKEEEVKSQTFHDRAQAFLADGRDERLIHIEVAGQYITLPVSQDGGYFDSWVETSASTGAVSFSSLPSRVNPGRYSGTAYVADEGGVSVISDVEDTLEVSEVKDHKEMLRNMFVRPYQAVPGMAELYQTWKKQFGETIQFHFLSGTPAQFYGTLSQFTAQNNFPTGAWHLRKLENIGDLEKPTEEFKIPQIREIFRHFPKRKFILVGTSSEHDPEIYAQILREFGGQVLGVYIRNITDEPQDSPRYKQLYLQAAKLKVFTNASEIGPISSNLTFAQAH